MNKSRHAITDIEFLNGPAIKPRNQIIYLYEKFSGVLRPKVRDRVIKFAESIGCRWMVPGIRKLQDALLSSTLFELDGQPPFIIADLGDIKRIAAEKAKFRKACSLLLLASAVIARF